MADVASIAEELCRATGLWPNGVLTDVDAWIKNLLHGVSALTEEEYNGIPAEAMKWYEEAVEASNIKMPLPELPGLDEVQAMNGAEKPAARVAKPAEDGTDAKTKAKRKRAAKKGTPAPAEKKPRQLSGSGKVSKIALVMIENPTASVDDIKAAFTKAKTPPPAESVVPTFRSAFRNILSMLKREGVLTKELANKIDY